MANQKLRNDINIRSHGYFIAHRVATCWRCQASTPLLALVLPPEHETLSLDADADAERDELAQDTWQTAPVSAILFYIGYLPEAVQRWLKDISPFYRFAHCAATQGAYWANHCERCDSLLDDHELFCEPEGAFLPMSPASAAAIHLLRINESFEAAAAGYGHDPQFLALSRRA
jgi:hypothetical protein